MPLLQEQGRFYLLTLTKKTFLDTEILKTGAIKIRVRIGFSRYVNYDECRGKRVA
jgi:hypothetical protein